MRFKYKILMTVFAMLCTKKDIFFPLGNSHTNLTKNNQNIEIALKLWLVLHLGSEVKK